MTGSFDKRNIIDNAKNVCVFGLGQYFEDAFKRQNVRNRFNVGFLCDNNNKDKFKQIQNKGSYFLGISCISKDELSKLEDVVVILMLGNPRSAEDELGRLGIKNVISYNDLILDEVMNGNLSKKWFESQVDEIFTAYDILDNEESKKVFVNVLCNRIAPQLSQFSYEELCVKPQYFSNDIINLNDNEIMVNCGAYDGDTLEKFLDVTNKQFDKAYCFELDEDNYYNLCNRIAQYDKNLRSKLECFNYGVWNENKTISYGKMSSADSFSIFNRRETIEAKVIKLDDILKDKNITFIKMDIEGAEMMALKGGAHIIKTQKPKVAICVYHRIEDLWKIPLYLKKLVPDYNISMRHHANYYVSETVCYAHVD
ncbi:MAG: FkbM family methyltransferase [Cellulosilyticaceae bacterium]